MVFVQTGGRGAIVDPVLGMDLPRGRSSRRGHGPADAVIAFVQAQAFTIEAILASHVHADNLSASPYVLARAGGRMAIGREPLFGWLAV